MARENDILCLPFHYTHNLQPLDVGVIKSLKANFNKVCKDFLFAHPGRSIKSEDLISLFSLAWPHALTPSNVMKGFKQCGIFQLITELFLTDSWLLQGRFRLNHKMKHLKQKLFVIPEIFPHVLIYLILPRAQSLQNVRSINTDSARCIANDLFIKEKKEEKKRKEEEKKKKERREKKERRRKEEERNVEKKEEEKIRKLKEKKRKKEERKEAKRKEEDKSKKMI